jgi:hypothetical protein
MAEPINEASAAVTALFKFYQENRERYYPIASASDEYPDEVFAATLATATTSQTIIRLIQSSGGTWKSLNLWDPTVTTQATIEIPGTFIGDFARSNNKVYYSNYNSPVRQMRPRRSAGDTSAYYCWEAGLPDPNAIRVIDRCEETAGWTYSAGGGAGESIMDYSPLRRTQGRAAITFSQTTPGSTSSLTFAFSAAQNLDAFTDGTVAEASDYIAFEVFRFGKTPISELWVDLSDSSGFSSYYCCPVTTTPGDTLYGLATQSDSETWDNYHWDQTTHQAKWSNNPYDNQLFRIRIQKSWFAACGSITWTAINTARFRMKGNSNATSANPAKVAIDDVRLLKNPGYGTPFRIQCALCEEQESGSTTGWESDEGASTKATFNKQIARNGVSAVVVPEMSGAGATATVTLRFDSGVDMGTFPDGQTAASSDVLRMNMSTKGWGDDTYFADWAAVFTAPKIRFYNNANYRSTRFFILNSMKGGGITKQVRFDTSPTDGGSISAPWSGSGTMDWSNVTKVALYGPYHNSLTANSFIIDDIRIERPKAMQAVNIFEPVDLYAIDVVSELIQANLKEYGWVVELGTEAFKGLWGLHKYQTYGMGHATYPDYEHSSFGIAGLTIAAYGSKPFGMLLQHDPLDVTNTLDLTNYKIFTLQYPPVFDFEDNWGFVKVNSIPASPNDKFEIWIASPKPTAITVVRIKFHGNDGSNNADRNNYWYHEITGQELAWGLREQVLRDSAASKQAQAIQKQYAELQKSDLTTKIQALTNPANKDIIETYFRDAIRIKGVDRGGWQSGTFSWKRKNMILSKDSGTNRVPDFADIRGISVEITGEAGGAQICVDNLIMKKEGSLNGTYYYKTVLEDEEGYLSPSTEPSLPVVAAQEDVVLNNIYVPNAQDSKRVFNKRIYRIGGTSSEWRHVGDVAVDKDTFLDNVIEENAKNVLPEEAYAPPQAKVMKNIGNSMYYANIVSRLGETLPYRVMVSEAFAPFRVNDFKAVDIPERNKGGGVTGIEEYYGNILVWTADSLHTTTMGLTEPPIHRSDKGCIAKRSVTKTDYGVVWLSREGLMMGDQSRVDDKWFEPVNSLFESYTETQLENAIGLYRDRYFYLFYDSSLRKGLVCYMPDRLFSELGGSSDSTGPFDVHSVSHWDGQGDLNDIYYGRSNGTIYKMFDGNTDDGTAITTKVKTMSFSHPGHQHDKQFRSAYISTRKIASSDVTLTPKVYADEVLSETMPIVTATLTSVKTIVTKGGQGNTGTHLAYEVDGVNRHMISQITMKVTPEPDTEYLP